MTSERLTLGIIAHVDAGKTTLAEDILYRSGVIRQKGRVDHGDTFLDTYAQEKARGITIFSSQAVFSAGSLEITLLDTPGHVDFSPETERVMPVLDACILVVSAPDGVRSHTVTLWELLRRYGVPTFIFVNKMDRAERSRAEIIRDLEQLPGGHFVDFTETDTEEFYENVAVSDEDLLTSYLETGEVTDEQIRGLTGRRLLSPCFFGAALHDEGVAELLEGLARFAPAPVYGSEFGARVYKISRDDSGNRLTHMKITGGSLKAKTVLDIAGVQEKADQIRIYSGDGYEPVPEAEAGQICTVTGLKGTYPGEGLGVSADAAQPMLAPVLIYSIEFPEGTDTHEMYRRLLELSEEEPTLRIAWDSASGEIRVHVMGEIELQILDGLIRERLGTAAEFVPAGIVYKETITNTVEGVGHYEPLRHYAEVHLIMEPGERGSGLVFAADCPEEILERNWQRLVLTHLYEREHKGVLTGSDITDMKITLVSGRAHIKHTEGGDFREATYRAVRQGLMKADSLLLEPVYSFRLQVPQDRLGRSLNDLSLMAARQEAPKMDGVTAVITGTVPVATIAGYANELVGYTGGEGRLELIPAGYQPCHNAEDVIRETGYIPEADLENPASSVFCSHGAGYLVPWDEVDGHMHMESVLKERAKRQRASGTEPAAPVQRSSAGAAPASAALDKELEAIFTRTYGERKERYKPGRDLFYKEPEQKKEQKKENLPEYLLVDGYNIIFAWEELSRMAGRNVEVARGILADILSNYKAFHSFELILVYDAYKVRGNPGEVIRYGNIDIIYTKEAETADQYIEKTAHSLQRKARVTVATSDALEQVIILGAGASRMSAKDLYEDVERTGRRIREICESQEQAKNYLFDNLPPELALTLEEVRLGRKQLSKADEGEKD